jgi:hypothetical protein
VLSEACPFVTGVIFNHAAKMVRTESQRLHFEAPEFHTLSFVGF